MKQRRVFMTLGLILGILALSLAYAAITTQTLEVTVNATAATSDANFNVKFTGDVTSSADGTVTGYIDTTDKTGRTAVINVSELTTEGQKATASINIINNSEEVKAMLSIASITHTNSTWYKIDAEIGETTYWDSSTQKPILLPGETVPAYIIVELLQTPATDADVSAAVDTMEIIINAEPTDADAVLDNYGSGSSSGAGGDTEEVELLSFEVEGVTYYAPTTYTWQQFIDDETYNTAGWGVRNYNNQDLIYESDEKFNSDKNTTLAVQPPYMGITFNAFASDNIADMIAFAEEYDAPFEWIGFGNDGGL